MSERLRVLTFSTLYPSSVRPGHGIFVETRLRELLKTGQVDARVIAPVPWFPSTNERFRDYARMARTPQREIRNGIEVLHPRYPLPPKVGMTVAPLTLALGARGAVQRLLDEGFDFDVIDAHYFYPDGVAAALLARWFGRPFTITARGSDLTLLAQHALPRRMMKWAAARAGGAIGVCQALVDVMRGWALPEAQLHVMRNGVDLQRFQPRPKSECRERIGQGGEPLLLAVGNLLELKGHHILIDALVLLRARHPGARLVIVGEGPLRQQLQAQIDSLGLASSAQLIGRIAQEELLHWYGAADALLLGSSREGWANVLLEAMACGTPVVATNVWGTPEVVGEGPQGRLVERNAPAFAEAVEALLHAGPERARVRAYAEGFDWQATSAAQLDLFSCLAQGAAHAPTVCKV